MGNIYQNARISYFEKAMKEGISARKVSDPPGVGSRAACKRPARYRMEGEPALHNRYSLLHPVRRLPIEMVSDICAMRRMLITGPAIIHDLSMPFPP